jgi:hypothetical protein
MIDLCIPTDTLSFEFELNPCLFLDNVYEVNDSRDSKPSIAECL